MHPAVSDEKQALGLLSRFLFFKSYDFYTIIESCRVIYSVRYSSPVADQGGAPAASQYQGSTS